MGWQAARNYVLPYNYRVRLAQPNTFHQLTLVLGRVGGTGTNDFEGEASPKIVWVGRLRQIQFCLIVMFRNRLVEQVCSKPVPNACALMLSAVCGTFFAHVGTRSGAYDFLSHCLIRTANRLVPVCF